MLEAVRSGRVEPLYLVRGDRVAAEPAAVRLGRALAESGEHEVEVVKRPAGLRDVLGSLRTLSLFGSGRTVVVVESAVLADKASAADLLDEAAQVEVEPGDGDLTTEERRAAGLLLQALRLFGQDPEAGAPAETLGSLPAWALQGGKRFRARRQNRPRGKKQVAEMAASLERLLAAAREAGLRGFAEGDLAELGELSRGGFPDGHRIVLAESVVDKDHPLVRDLAERGALIDLGRVSQVTRGANRGNWEGLGPIIETLAADTGVGIEGAALDELVRRTLQTGRGWNAEVKADSTERLAAEYRKLATMADGDRITRELVLEGVEDRGDQDFFGLLDAIGSGDASDATARLTRILAAADDPMATRLQLFTTLADFARLLTAVAGMARAAGVPRGVSSFDTFRNRWEQKLKQSRPYGAASPIDTKLHAYRLFKAYSAASRMSNERLGTLPVRTLETETLLKGGSRQPDTVLAAFVAELAG